MALRLFLGCVVVLVVGGIWPTLGLASADGGVCEELEEAGGGLGVIDWVVMGGYGLGMLAVGWYYSRRTANQEDYLLGGRNMRPWAVGLSLFATLLSTLSYLAVPGEMIKHGPMLLISYTSFPLIFLIVGWFLIPFIMKLKVTSAYEILEMRLGLSVRMLGTFFFLSLRLLWMATIIYTTTSLVLIPLLGVDRSYLPWLASGLGLLTVVYTSMGGLRAVVLTDVAQSVILFCGAILALVLITVRLGGVGEWFPTSWAENWAEPSWGFDPNARICLVSAMLMSLFWYVCTAGSDQMAVQRYLATRDVKAARRAFGVSLISDFSITVFLAILGFALLAYFNHFPDKIPAGETIDSASDRLFPRFIEVGLPVGIRGLVTAGLLAAAMSSLSSGVNSSCSVVTVDFFERFRKDKQADYDQVRMAKVISLVVGVVVVVLSLFIGQVQGNLFEVLNKVANLFVSPLFLLFFMAMFIPWATSFGTIVAALCSVGAAVAIAFYEVLGLSFTWIMPVSLVVGILVGMAVSLLPVGSKMPEGQGG